MIMDSERFINVEHLSSGIPSNSTCRGSARASQSHTNSTNGSIRPELRAITKSQQLQGLQQPVIGYNDRSASTWQQSGWPTQQQQVYSSNHQGNRNFPPNWAERQHNGNGDTSPFIDYLHQQAPPTPVTRYQQTEYQPFNQSAYHSTTAPYNHQNSDQTRFIGPARHSAQSQNGFAGNFPVPGHSTTTNMEQISSPSPTSIVDTLAAQITSHMTVSGQHSPPSVWSSPPATAIDYDDSDSEDDDSLSHPNKFPVEIEDHGNKSCTYKRQPIKSGLKVKQVKSSVYDPMTSQHRNDTQHIKYYQKDLVRVCRCGKYKEMDGALAHGRANDCDGYEIHYSQKCKWKAYDDFRTGKRVLIRLCKCYKPT